MQVIAHIDLEYDSGEVVVRMRKNTWIMLQRLQGHPIKDCSDGIGAECSAAFLDVAYADARDERASKPCICKRLRKNIERASNAAANVCEAMDDLNDEIKGGGK